MLANVLVGFVAFIHVYILVLEMFLWEHPRGRKAFGTSAAFAAETKAMAANQGLYNGFLAAGLIWGLAQGVDGRPVQLFFLGCAFVAGVYGALTVARKILFIQSVPAAAAVAAVWWSSAIS